MFNNITPTNTNFNTHQLSCGPNQLNYAMFNNHIPTRTSNTYYSPPQHQTYILPPPPPPPPPQPQPQTHQSHTSHAHTRQPAPQQQQLQQQKYALPPYKPYNISYVNNNKYSKYNKYQARDYCIDTHRQIPINMNVSYKKASINIHNNHTHHYHHNTTNNTNTHPSISHPSYKYKYKYTNNSNCNDQKQQSINVHYHFHDPSISSISIPPIPPIPPLPSINTTHISDVTSLPLPSIPTIPNLANIANMSNMSNMNLNNHNMHVITPYLASATPVNSTTIPRSSSITSDTSVVATQNMLSELMNESTSKLMNTLSKQEMLFFQRLNARVSGVRSLKKETSNHKRISFPSGDRHSDKYIGLKRIGAGTFADIWEVYDQFDPNRKHWAIKVLKKSKCINKENKRIDNDKYIKYTNAMIAEGNRILRLNKQDKSNSSHIIKCKEILKHSHNNSSNNNNNNTRTSDKHNKNNIGPCVVLELMGISLLQYTQLYEKNKQLIPLITVRCIAIQLFNSLSFLHGIGGYIHADLKPENVLITLKHSINGNLMNNKYPNIKIVDLGNALSYNRNINTFEVQSLYYRAPEVLFGNEMTSSIDLWSIGCILFELININEFNSKLYFKSNNNNNKIDRMNNTSTPSKKKRHHHALFACCNRMELASKINDILSPYPNYVYNKYSSYYYNDLYMAHTMNYINNNNNINSINISNYNNLKDFRKKQLIKRLNTNNGQSIQSNNNNNHNIININTNLNEEYLDFIDLISCLLDLNPSTRYTSEDAIQHSFCINLKYIQNDIKILTLITNKYHSSYPVISISNDFDRQYRIIKQIEQFNLFKQIEINNPNNNSNLTTIPIPKEMAVTRKNNSFAANYSTGSMRQNTQNTQNTHTHNKIICLLNGCCNNPTIKKQKYSYNHNNHKTIIPPLKKMKFTNQ